LTIPAPGIGGAALAYVPGVIHGLAGDSGAPGASVAGSRLQIASSRF